MSGRAHPQKAGTQPTAPVVHSPWTPHAGVHLPAGPSAPVAEAQPPLSPVTPVGPPLRIPTPTCPASAMSNRTAGAAMARQQQRANSRLSHDGGQPLAGSPKPSAGSTDMFETLSSQVCETNAMVARLEALLAEAMPDYCHRLGQLPKPDNTASPGGADRYDEDKELDMFEQNIRATSVPRVTSMC
jgi:hypothetical protein